MCANPRFSVDVPRTVENAPTRSLTLPFALGKSPESGIIEKIVGFAYL
jgi:hypothetical protein